VAFDDPATTFGMVAVLDANLNLVNLVCYKDVRVFYSAYAQDGFYFVCGQMRQVPYLSTAIILRDSLYSQISLVNIEAFQTPNQPNWAFHKIAVRDATDYRPCSFELNVSIGGETEANQEMGWAVFQMNSSLGSFTFYNSAYSFNPDFIRNSKVTIANLPPFTLPPPTTNFQGILLSASSGTDIYTYVFNNNRQRIMNNAFIIRNWHGKLEDMDCGGNDPNKYEIAWVGNRLGTAENPQRTADYIHTYMPYPAYYSYVPPLAQWIYFIPFNATLDRNMYYSLHKVHYFPDYRLGGDNQFHAGGYYNEGRETANDRNRTTFAVTPNGVPVSNQCTYREMISTEHRDTIPLTPIAIERVPLEGEPLQKLTKWYRFCTMDCDKKRDDDCGNFLINK
jgi:hypothetical protein